MTKKKPPGMTFASFVDQQIREAQEKGEFENLPGEGEPLRDLEESYNPVWWVKKLVKREKISMLPPALEARRKVERALDQIFELRDEARVRQRVEDLNVEIAGLNSRVTTGPATHIGRLDVDSVVLRWRRLRAESDDADA